MSTVLLPEQAIEITASDPLTLSLRPVIELTDDQLLELSSLNRDLRLEKTSHGELVVMSPAGSKSGMREIDVAAQLHAWSKKDGTGIMFGPSAGFRFPNGAIRAPDASWIRKDRLRDFSEEEWEKYLPICPDFVIEVRSPSDTLRSVKAKMKEYIENGAQLGWLLDATNRHVYVYRADGTVERLDDLDTVSGDPLLPGFELNLREVW